MLTPAVRQLRSKTLSKIILDVWSRSNKREGKWNTDLLAEGEGIPIQDCFEIRLGWFLGGNSLLPLFSAQSLWDGCSNITQSYADCICATTEGPYPFGCCSFGGLMTFEAAWQLLKQYHSVAGVVLIDAPALINHQPIKFEIVEDVLNALGRLTSECVTSCNVLSSIRRQFLRNATTFAEFHLEITVSAHNSMALTSPLALSTKVRSITYLPGRHKPLVRK